MCAANSLAVRFVTIHILLYGADWETIEMLKWFKELDQILRGDATRMSLLAEDQIQTPVAGLSVAIVLLGVLYGLCAGSFAMIRTGGEAYMHMIASAIKLPMLFFLTLWRLHILPCTCSTPLSGRGCLWFQLFDF